MLKLHLGHIDALDQAIAAIEKEVGLGLEPFRQAAKLLSTMPGLSAVGSNVVVAEIGIDMSRFATPGHLLSWACMCPRNDESAGKRRSTRLRRGGKWLKTTMVQAAWAAIKVKGSYLQAQFHRLRARRGAKKAIIAVAASMLTAAWHMLRDGTEWHDLGAAHFDRADAHKTAIRLIRRLQQIGYAVQLTPSERDSFILVPQYFNAGDAKEELVQDLRPVLGVLHERGLVQVLGHEHRVARLGGNPGEARIAAAEPAGILALADDGAIGADHKQAAVVRAARRAAGQPQIVVQRAA